MVFKKRRIFDMHHVQAHHQPGSNQNNTLQNPYSSNSINIADASYELCKGTTHYKRQRYLYTQYQSVKKWFVKNLYNYCNTTSLHGFNYITRQDISQAERIFWIVIVVLSIIVSIVLVLVSWFSNRETPTVTVIESSHFPTWNIPFPSITICNFNKISKTKSKSVMESLQVPANTSQYEVHRLFNVTLYPEAANFTQSELNTFDKILKLNNMTVADLTLRLTPDCLDMISRCIWKGMNTRCEALFQKILTMEGQCCTFNYFGAVTNNFPEKIAYQIPKRPYRVTGCGYPTGLSVLLNPMVMDYFGTFFSSYGFRLLIHNAYNYPDENAETKVVTSTRETFVRINPESTYATNDIRRMNILQRNCLFGNERKLPMMQEYSFINCMFECRIQMTYLKCGCLPNYLPNNGSYKICDVLQTNCVISSKRIFSHAIVDLNSSLSIVRETRDFPCNCLPDCQSNQYVSEITTGRLNVNFVFNRVTTNTVPKSTNQTDYILLHVFFSDLMSTRYRMELFQNWLSALASFGGLLGLIMGFSIVTAFEFLYFLTFRPAFNYFNSD